MRPASASRLTSPIVAEAVPPALVIASTRLSTPPQFWSRSPGALCSLATPVGRRSETTTATPLAASARAVELPMPIGLPQPVISATRDEWGMSSSYLGIAWFVGLSWLAEAARPVAIVNPRQVRKFAEALGQLAKTDAIDARVIAHFAEAVRPPPRPMPDPMITQLQELLARRRQLVVMINAEKQRFAKAESRITQRS